MITLTQNEILEELIKFGVNSEDDLQVFYREYALYLNHEDVSSGENI